MSYHEVVSARTHVLGILLAGISLASGPTARADEAAPPVAASASASTAAPPAPAAQEPESKEERTANNAAYVELLGPALLYSVNYERTFADVYALRIGLEYFSLSATNTNGTSASATFLAVPLTFSYLGIGSLKHIFEIGAGGALLYFGGSVNTLGNSTSGSAVGGLGTLIFGYRYMPPKGGFMFRAGISPLISSTGGFLPWPYASFGATF
jgi:hypothetical protein